VGGVAGAVNFVRRYHAVGTELVSPFALASRADSQHDKPSICRGRAGSVTSAARAEKRKEAEHERRCSDEYQRDWEREQVDHTEGRAIRSLPQLSGHPAQHDANNQRAIDIANRRFRWPNARESTGEGVKCKCEIQAGPDRCRRSNCTAEPRK